ncbi:site-specific recombinase XerD [Jatrophihabitans sp. GAS493]|uniref:tyrosine-type recombinase/integrase n=1 Tax=Jatrophihabitans sp. GAS493 TaxID=1907575 RepID=UPI000BB94317|nr:site-specific integrase [Jatrophihabitans sp. GAS493]SOD72700.1 site-specific recombinase XerD [Jatrophihabitans sp. GAS493]
MQLRGCEVIREPRSNLVLVIVGPAQTKPRTVKPLVNLALKHSPRTPILIPKNGVRSRQERFDTQRGKSVARAKTTPGTHGAITVIRQTRLEPVEVELTKRTWRKASTDSQPLRGKAAEGVQRYRAIATYRDKDGKSVAVERFATTAPKAEHALKLTLSSWETKRTGSTVRTDSTVEAAGLLWLAEVKRSALSPNTLGQYQSTFDRVIADTSLAALTLREANRVPVLRQFLQGVADERGAGTAKTTRSVLSSILRFAVEDGVLDYNAMRDIRPVKAAAKKKSSARDTSRALTREERDHLLRVADEHEMAARLDAADIVWWMAATGCRITEALTQQWEDIDLTADVPTALIRGTKSASAERRLSLSPRLVERLRQRAAVKGTDGFVFKSPRAGEASRPRDRRNVARCLRQVLDAAGLPWATPHTLRRTAVTLLSEQGVPIAAIADLAGHANPAMTQNVYLGRNRANVVAGMAVL